MTVEGIGISSISRINCFSRNTIASWQYFACKAAGRFNDHKLKGVKLIELQAYEIRTFTGTKKKPMWICNVVGNRNYCSVKTLLAQVINTCRKANLFIFTTDGFEPYFWAAKRTPAMQAGLVKKQLSFREIFTTIEIIFWWICMFVGDQTRVKELARSTAQ